MINIDVVPLGDFLRSLRVRRSEILRYASSLARLMGTIDDPGLPSKSEKQLIQVDGSFPIILYRSQSKEAVGELVDNALLFLKVNYVVNSLIESRLSELDPKFNVMVRYFGDTPSSVVILLDDNKE
jgi:hypothetical protein